METGTSNVFQVLQDLRMQQYQGNSEPRMHRPNTTSSQKPQKHRKVAKQPARKQVHTLTICLQFRLLSGPYQLQNPTQHTVLDDQPLEYINLTHTVNTKPVVCMYTNNRARLTGWKNRQP